MKRSLLRAAALLTCTLSGMISSTAAAEPAAVLIRNVVIVDGSGAPSYPGAVRIADGRIAEVGRALQARPGEQVHDGEGHVLAPGFIDTQSS